MHAARIENSLRLQRVEHFLSDNLPHSTLEIVQGASVCAVNSIVAELRHNGRVIACWREGDIWFYRMAPAEQQEAA